LGAAKEYIGIDAGGTLIKVAHETPDGAVRFHKFGTAGLAEAAAWAASREEAAIALTGGKAAPLQALIGRPANHLVEFEATCSGVRWLMRRDGLEQDSFLLTNVGTGTSIHHVDGERHRRIGGTGVGGGTLVGLSAMTTGVKEFDEIVRLASEGKRDDIDLLVRHIYEGSTPPIPGELTASNFGRWLQTGGSDRPENVLASVVGLVGETVATVSVHAAGQCGASCVMYIGSSFIRNELLRKVVAGYTELRGSRAVMVRDGEYSGAVGALLSLKRGGAA